MSYIVMVESYSDGTWYYEMSPNGETHITQHLDKAMHFADPKEAEPVVAELVFFSEFVKLVEVVPDATESE